MNYSELQPFDISNTGIHPTNGLNSIQVKETNLQVQPLIEIKESILDIINKNEDIQIDEKDLENKDVKTLIENIHELTPSFQKLQDELSEIDKEYKEEMVTIKKKISSIDSMISFINQISYSNIDPKDLQELIDKMKSISEEISNNEKLTKLRESYIQKRKELHPHLSLMKHLNQWNIANMCPICFKNPVSHFLNPCGHTGCKECLERNRREMNTNQQLPQSDLYFECAFCRKQISSMKPLFFL
jgi:DNA repair exonuclease SbcCD ATPase subunit